MFNKYVYTKNITDPAPRLIQECKYHDKEIIYEYTNRGAEVYKNRLIENLEINSIVSIL